MFSWKFLFHLTFIPEFPEFSVEWFAFRKFNNYRIFWNFRTICPRFENFEIFGRMVSAHGRDPFNQNFRKFRSKTEWIGLVQPEKFRKSGPPFDHFSQLVRSDRTGPFHLTIPTHSQSQDLAVRYLAKWRKILIAALLWIVNSVLLVHPCTVTTGL